MEIPVDRLSPEALRAIVEAFVCQEGTDYGEGDVSLEEKISQVMAQIAEGRAVIRFNAEDQTCGVFPSESHTVRRR